ncbi:hypothetical protein AAL_04847 [Moelleriella libera RCEF 2490]|uniref:Uncharacterized protein n=1 Tax=Moelleriella libera RCEF 2490 TaxID=1081109 RepID=A0A168B3D8_9HYPO|nr:hypothetical protein AAL_04847 [Moelleriella libera RCEF 2490]
MTSFFAGWQLWQQMTFVLGCCIVIVFLMGLARLWHINQQIRRYELLDEEQRSRIAEMRHCGISHHGRSTVAFGARAIENGEQMDGIWNSFRPKGKGKLVSSPPTPVFPAPIHTDSDEHSTYYSLHDTPCDSDDQGKSSSIISACSVTPSRQQVDEHIGQPRPSEEASVLTRAHHETRRSLHRPSRSHDVTSRGSDQDSFTLSEQQIAWHRPRTRALSLDSSRPFPAQTRPQVHGSAQVYVNRNHRKSNTGFEILPAGTLGSRPELPEERHRPVTSDSRRTLRRTRSIRRLRKQRS